MISSNSREKGFDQAKQEGDTNESNKLIPKQPPSSSSRQWSGFRNPRIVRVSRSFGGKDRHSKVCTIRGLRDRRIRLSVPTAIQLYDLQDRLGLSQPSKVIDWLLDVTKLDIDKLPPLQIPPGLFGHHHQFHNNQQQQQPMMIQSIDHGDHQDDQSNKYWDLEASSSLNMRAKGKEVENTMPLLNPYYYHWDPSQFGSGHEFVSHQQAADQNAFPSGSHNHHLFFCPPAAATMPSLFPTYVTNAQDGTHDHSSRQLINHLQLLSSSSPSSQQVKPFSLNVNLGYAESNPDKEDT